MKEYQSIRIAGIIRESIVDGPGIRFVIFCQGCPHHCEGCHNPQSHDFEAGYDCEISKIMDAIDQNPLLKGVTFSGGEPMCKAGEFAYIARQVKERNLDLTVFTGYTYEELLAKNDDDVNELLSYTDYLVDGRFVLSKRDLTLKFRGSSNQRIIDMNKTRENGKMTLAEEYM